MNIEAFVLCDAATESGGKLNVLGAFDTVFARELPVVHPFCAVALRLRFERIEEGEHKVRISFVEEDGKNVLPPLDGAVNIHFAPGQPSACANLILNLSGVKFPKFGQCSIDLALDGRFEKSLPLFVRQMPAAGGQQQAGGN
ncbi:MAG: hypothetical protein A2178_01305 [Planctomycetes bacterium GWC2_49_10]|nr:MAG: hypothetical protein A2178_01305 [Planctomycetes bacterium GWC2_49_10]